MGQIQNNLILRKRIVRLMTFRSYFDHSEPIFSDLRILNLNKPNEYVTSMFMFCPTKFARTFH